MPVVQVPQANKQTPRHRHSALVLQYIQDIMETSDQTKSCSWLLFLDSDCFGFQVMPGFYRRSTKYQFYFDQFDCPFMCTWFSASLFTLNHAKTQILVNASFQIC